ncbi:MAG: helix-turn-helix domain-containing protein [Planctomycetota bacterium]|jgi:transcriptional regulator with XRE-family HTH domain
MQAKTSAELDKIKSSLGDRIRKLRSDKGLTQSAFCEKNLLKTPANLSGIEKGRTFPTLDTIIRICMHSKVSADSLLFGSPLKALKDDAETFSALHTAVERLIKQYARLLTAHEASLQNDLDIAKAKQEQMLLTLEGVRAGVVKLNQGDSGVLFTELPVVRNYIALLEKDLENVRAQAASLVKDKDFILRTLK